MTSIAERPGDRGEAAGTDAERWRLSAREGLAILAFWTLFAVLTIPTRLLGDLFSRSRGEMVPGRPPPLPGTAPLYEAFFWLFNSYLWAAVTPLIFWLAWRFGMERWRRVSSILLFLGAGAAMVTAMMLARRLVWVDVLGFPPVRGANLSLSMRGNIVNAWFLNDLVMYGGVLAVGFTREYFVRYRLRLEESAHLHAQAAQLQAQLADARLEALRMQLNPHFLFNTLHAISSLVERDPRGVRRMIARLSELLRYTLQGSNRREVPVEQEMGFLRKYLDIMQVRFEGRLEIDISVAPDVEDALVPSLILQPLVENAVKHGVSNWIETGRIEIYATRSGDRLVLGVRDNGPGLQPELEPAGGGGLGLQNVRARLQQLYGEDQSVALRPGEDGGVVAEIELPLHTRADVRLGEDAPAPAHAAHDG